MIVVPNLLFGFAVLLNMGLEFYFWIVIGSAVVSWVNADPWNPIVRFLRSATSPVYARLRRWVPALSAGALDFTPLLVLGALKFLQIALVGSLFEYATYLKSA